QIHGRKGAPGRNRGIAYHAFTNASWTASSTSAPGATRRATRAASAWYRVTSSPKARSSPSRDRSTSDASSARARSVGCVTIPPCTRGRAPRFPAPSPRSALARAVRRGRFGDRREGRHGPGKLHRHHDLRRRGGPDLAERLEVLEPHRVVVDGARDLEDLLQGLGETLRAEDRGLPVALRGEDRRLLRPFRVEDRGL